MNRNCLKFLKLISKAKRFAIPVRVLRMAVFSLCFFISAYDVVAFAAVT